MARLSLEEKNKNEAAAAMHSARLQQEAGLRQTETDRDMVFSTGDTSMQTTTTRDAKGNLHMNSQSSTSATNVEMMSSANTGGTLSSRLGERLDPRLIPPEYPPPELLSRPSLSESTVGLSKNFSPQFDRMSSHTKNAAARRGDNNQDLLADED